ncbi:MAG: hypothetical protein D8M58_03330 [Calditrichaeota bacterium]|nr:MAG: hypothetical protein DWQ03_03745 [Calditrichota bacterium]MBL1204398.1 hypothetical protein [Calditrichota bacterium]NOG44227.1 polysaccharide deacetylase family protein [Calditrichota bacterium]
MSITKHACKNHPQKFTAKRCYNCKAHICQECHKKHFHHIFCSLKCVVIWRAKTLLDMLKLSREFTWFVVVVLLSNIIMFNLFINRINSNLEMEPEKIANDSTAVFPVPEGFLIDSVRQAVKGSFEIKIAGRENRVHTLNQNGKFVEALLPKESDFSFESVSLEKGNNRFAIWALTAEGQSILVDSFSVKYSSPRLDYLMNPVYRVKTGEKKLALTFDGGSSNKGTQQILDILYKKKIKCTMFLTGRFIENFPDLVNQIIDAGHEIGNHSLTHPHFTTIEENGKNDTRKKVTYDYFRKQLNITDSIYFALRKKHLIPFWRAPFGEINREILMWAGELGYRHIGWSYKCDSWDWVADKSSNLYRTSEQIKEHFLNLEQDKGLSGKILLMHLGSERKDDFPYQNLASLIDELETRGYEFIKVSELLKLTK